MARNEKTFSESNQPKKPRGKGVRTKMIEALGRADKSEEDFYDILINKAINDNDQVALGEVLKRMSQVPKQVSPLVSFEFPKDGGPAEQASATLKAIADGDIPADIGSIFIQSIKTLIDIEEHTELKARLADIERSLGIASE